MDQQVVDHRLVVIQEVVVCCFVVVVHLDLLACFHLNSIKTHMSTDLVSVVLNPMYGYLKHTSG